jgi:uncharacterized protein (DUF1330 family)
LRGNAGHANNNARALLGRVQKRYWSADGNGQRRETAMAKAYWVSTYFSVSNPEALAEYAKLAGPAITAGGGKFIARGTAAKAYEKGTAQRVVIIEFDSVEKAAAAHDGPGYQAALKVLGNGAQRDIRIVEGL